MPRRAKMAKITIRVYASGRDRGLKQNLLEEKTVTTEAELSDAVNDYMTAPAKYLSYVDEAGKMSLTYSGALQVLTSL
ncbi:MAG: hypothetical protein UX79_C0006G0029 [candidate division WWE3 bacterium GW2011_GWB1_47_11]|uniref:Uncharacterized protein n=2 Tax=Katanobacteria TaxID=422282 RepID=A0A0G1TU81_UNCKA|nr:MAG: hypothetical protein UX79_C0006G0029 [candidate division WWE3 bacterium GW2011_GWB1_47_11]